MHRVVRSDRHSCEQCGHHLGRPCRGNAARALAFRCRCEPHGSLAFLAGGRTPHAPPRVGKHRQHRVDRGTERRLDSRGRPGRLCGQQSGRHGNDTRAGQPMGTPRHPRQCGRARILPVPNDGKTARPVSRTLRSQGSPASHWAPRRTQRSRAVFGHARIGLHYRPGDCG